MSTDLIYIILRYSGCIKSHLLVDHNEENKVPKLAKVTAHNNPPEPEEEGEGDGLYLADLETTGFSNRDHVIEICVLDLITKEVFHQVVKVQKQKATIIEYLYFIATKWCCE